MRTDAQDTMILVECYKVHSHHDGLLSKSSRHRRVAAVTAKAEAEVGKALSKTQSEGSTSCHLRANL